VTSIAAVLSLAFGLGTLQPVQATAQPTLPRGTVVQTNATETKEIPFSGGSKVVLRPNSRFTYENIPGASTLMTVLDGEAAIYLVAGDKMVLKTSAGGALMTTGSYAVRCEPSCAAMLVTVGTGLALIRHESTKGISLQTGEKGRLPKDGAPEKVEGGKGWPAVEPAKPADGGRRR
jgi:ferric-dicitrate binding protein FerR (iron transport regulator)